MSSREPGTGRPPAKKRMSAEAQYFAQKRFSKDDIVHRHAKHGYDPLDAAFKQLRDEARLSAPRAAPPLTPPE